MAKPKTIKIPGQHISGYATEKTVLLKNVRGELVKKRVKWVRNRKGFQEVIEVKQ